MILKLSIQTLLAMVLRASCSKEEAPPASVEKPPARKVEPATPAPEPAAPASVKPAALPTATAPAPAPAPTGGDLPQAAALESSYVSNPDFTARVDSIYKLTDLGTPEAIASLGRLFHAEKDTELKTEILDALFDIDGQDERKIAILAAGAGADQPKEVRQSAIDALEDGEAKYARPILQSLVSDPDADISEAAKDALESLQEDDEKTK